MYYKYFSNFSKKSFCYCKFIIYNNKYFLDLDHHKSKSFNNNTLKIRNIWDDDFTIKDFIQNLNTTTIKDTKHLHPSFSVDSGNFSSNFNKQVLACVLNENLINSQIISKEANEKAKKYLSFKNFHMGAYSNSNGFPFILTNLTNNFYKNRDEYLKIKENDIYLYNGSIRCYAEVINFICEKYETVIIPNPCYKLAINCNYSYGIKSMIYNINPLTYNIDVSI